MKLCGSKAWQGVSMQSQRDLPTQEKAKELRFNSDDGLERVSVCGRRGNAWNRVKRKLFWLIYYETVWNESGDGEVVVTNVVSRIKRLKIST